MATYYAQATGNINAANMWNTDKDGGGSVLTWPPTPANNDILAANNKTVTVNVDCNIGTGKLTTETLSGYAGGGFTLSASVTITGNLVAGTQHCGTTSGTPTIAITGNCYGSDSTSSKYGLYVNSACIVNVTGTAYGGSQSTAMGCYFINASASGSVAAAVGGSGNAAFGVGVNGPVGLITVGNCTGGSYYGAQGLAAYTLATVTGNIINQTAVGVWGTIKYVPSAGKYIQFPWTTGTKNYGMEPAAGSLLSGTSVGSTAGTYIACPQADARLKEAAYYGAAGAVNGTCYVPTADEVLYGVDVDDTVGNVTLPNTDGSTPDASLVLDTAHFGPENATAGTYAGEVPVAITRTTTIILEA